MDQPRCVAIRRLLHRGATHPEVGHAVLPWMLHVQHRLQLPRICRVAALRVCLGVGTEGMGGAVNDSLVEMTDIVPSDRVLVVSVVL
jgi:hypothetical protein